MDLLFINPNQVTHLGSTAIDTKRCATEACTTTPTAASSIAAGAMVKRHSHSTVTSDDDHHESSDAVVHDHHAQHDDDAASSPAASAASVDHNIEEDEQHISSCFFDKDISEAASVANFYSKMEQELADELVTKTVQRVDNSISKSQFLQQNLTKMARVPIFTFADESSSSESTSNNTALVRGDLLGTGGFAHVYGVTTTTTTRDNNNNEDSSSSAFHHKKQYVVKQLAPTLLEHNCVTTVKGAAKKHNKKLFLGAKDIVLESYMLAALDHPHILKLEGISQGGIDRFGSTTRTDAYFMVLPKLTCTLSNKISKWKRQAPSSSTFNPECIRHSMSSSTTTTSLTSSSHSNENASNATATTTFMGTSSNWMMRKMDRRRRKREAKEAQQHSEDLFFCERLQIIIDLLKALEHLHEHRIMHRDIKPPNVGFDQDGCLKLFDFGLAKELPANAQVYSGECKKSKLNVAAATAANGGKRDAATHQTNANLYLQLGNTGTPRYMAPEIIRREPYHCKVDVYAASIVAWEVMTLKKPYGQDVTGQFVKECVAIYGDRPTPIPRKWPKALKKCIQQGWTRNTDARPSSNEMRTTLQTILEQQQHKMGLSIDV